MINQFLPFINRLIERLRFNKPERVLRQLTTRKTAQEIRDTTIVVTLQVRNPEQRKPGQFLTLTKYVKQYFPGFKDVDLDQMEVRFGEIPSLVPKEERFAVMYFVYERAVFDSGLVVCAFANSDNVQLLKREEVIYGTGYGEDKVEEKPFYENTCGEIPQPTSAE